MANEVPYDNAKELARSIDPDVRAELAAREDIVPEILYYLAEDPEPEVRRVIAGNAATPAQAHLLLAEDADDGVRASLAGQIARLAPGLTADEKDRVRRITYQVLAQLARDQAVRVRQILAEALKDIADAPPEVIRRLARDIELVVAEPVLESSPVLTDEDLLEIIETTTLSGALSAISRRANVPPHISDAIASGTDEAAIAALLANPSAQIREETLDRIVDRAPKAVRWHVPLVARPHLHRRAAIKLAHFVADALLHALTSRRDLDPATAAEVAKVVRRRIEQGDAAKDSTGEGRSVEDPAAVDAEPIGIAPHPPPKFAWREELLGAFERARKLYAKGGLGEPQIAKALSSGDEVFVAAALAARAGVPPGTVMAMLDAASAKGMVAVAWKAGLSPAFTVKLQTKLARVVLTQVLHPDAENRFALTEEELEWQIELFGDDGAIL